MSQRRACAFRVGFLALASAAPLSVSFEGDSLVAGLHIAHLDGNGALVAPPAAEYAIIEVGCSDRNTVDEDLDKKWPGAFLVSLEPLLDKYAVLAGRGSTRIGKGRDRGVPLGRHHERGVVLPVAVSTHGHEANITVHRWAGCSSLSDLNKDANYARLCQQGQVEKRRVPTITLEKTISLVPAHLPIRLLKLDAQGTDIQLLMSVDPRVLRRRVEYLQFETVGKNCKPIYVGQPPCDIASEYLKSIGFKVREGTVDACADMATKPDPYADKVSNFGWGCEANMYFERDRGGTAHGAVSSGRGAMTGRGAVSSGRGAMSGRGAAVSGRGAHLAARQGTGRGGGTGGRRR